MTNQAQKVRVNKINSLNAIAYTNANAIGYAKHMFIVYSMKDKK